MILTDLSLLRQGIVGRPARTKSPASPSACFANVSWTEISPDNHFFYPHSARGHIELPLDAKTLSFISAGPLTVGSIEISQTGDPEGDPGVVAVDVRYYRKQLLDRTFVCGRNPGDGK